MSTNDELKKIVREKYGEIASAADTGSMASCCGSSASSCCEPTDDLTVFSSDYSNLQGYNPDADLGLGCGLPTESSQIKKGDTVVDLGSGAGNDCFIARQITGEEGRVIGIDMTPKMIENARKNAARLNLSNVEFRLGEIENLPVQSLEADVVISNCVFNLVPDKLRAFEETFRILKDGGHFSISDIVIYDTLPKGLQEAAAMYAGCVSGAVLKEEYLDLLKQVGFTNIQVHREQKMQLPDELLKKYLDPNQMKEFKDKFGGIASITVYGEKHLKESVTNCC